MSKNTDDEILYAESVGMLKGEVKILREENTVLRFEARKLILQIASAHEKLGAAKYQLTALKAEVAIYNKL